MSNVSENDHDHNNDHEHEHDHEHDHEHFNDVIAGTMSCPVCDETFYLTDIFLHIFSAFYISF